MDERVGVVGGSMLVGVAGPVGAPGGDTAMTQTVPSCRPAAVWTRRGGRCWRRCALCVCLTGAL